MITALIPIAGNSQFFPKTDYHFPKPLIDVAGKTMIERVIENIKSISDDIKFVFVASEQDVARFSLDRTLKLLTNNNCSIVTLKNETKGALCSCLLAIDHIEPSSSLIIANGDQVIHSDLAEVVKKFVDSSADAGVVSFESVHPRWSYVLSDTASQAIQFAEKTVISKSAIAGFYYFATARYFFESAQASLLQGDEFDGAYYIAPSLNPDDIERAFSTSCANSSAKISQFFLPKQNKRI